MDIELPKLSDYDLLINKKKELIIKKQKENKIHKIKNYRNKKISNKIMHFYSQWKLMPEITELKKDIEQLKTKKLDIEENYQKHLEELNQDLYNIPDLPKRKKERKQLNLINNEGIFNIKDNNTINIEIPAIRMPSSYSVQILKRKRRINSDINIFSDKKVNREITNFSRDRVTNASTIIPSIRNSAMSSINNNNNNNGRKFNAILKIINRNKNKHKIEQPIISLKEMKINLFTNNNRYSSTISYANI